MTAFGSSVLGDYDQVVEYRAPWRVYYEPNEPPDPATWPTDGRLLAVSIKPTLGDVALGKWDNYLGPIRSWAAPEGRAVDLTEWHEADSRHFTASQLAAYRADRTHIGVLMSGTTVRSGPCLTAYNASQWKTYTVPGDRFVAFDCDGIPPGKTPADGYPVGHYQAACALAPLIREAGCGLAVWEAGWNPAPWDPTGAFRAAAIATLGPSFAQAEYALLWEGYKSDPALVGAWNALIKGGMQ